jgi:hypothetical protein
MNISKFYIQQINNLTDEQNEIKKINLSNRKNKRLYKQKNSIINNIINYLIIKRN